MYLSNNICWPRPCSVAEILPVHSDLAVPAGAEDEHVVPLIVVQSGVLSEREPTDGERMILRRRNVGIESDEF